VNKAILDTPESRDLTAPMVLSAQRGKQVPLAKLVTLVRLAKPARQALWEPMAEMVFSVQQAKWEPLAKLA
jgi:hypothetical protein